MVQALGKNILIDDSRLLKIAVISGVIHFVTFCLLILLPNLSSGPKISPLPDYTSVSLLSPGELSGISAPPKPVVIPKAKVSPSSSKPVPLQKKVETKPIEISKTEPKKPELIKTSPKKEETSPKQDQQLNEALNRIRDQVKNGAQAGMTGGTGVGAKAGGAGSGAPAMMVYLSIVIDRITQAWFLPPGLKEDAINRGLITIIDIRISRDGQVKPLGVSQSSGHSLFDDYSLKAIKKLKWRRFPLCRKNIGNRILI